MYEKLKTSDIAVKDPLSDVSRKERRNLLLSSVVGIIFSKAGIEIFESTDISYGWNGYYQNRLLPEGVYLYIAAGEFEGGQKFHNKGDITILHIK